MKTEQMKDENLTKIRSMLLNGEENKDVQTHYLLVVELIYYIPNVNDDPCLRLVIPNHMKQFVLTQFHDENGHGCSENL